MLSTGAWWHSLVANMIIYIRTTRCPIYAGGIGAMTKWELTNLNRCWQNPFVESCSRQFEKAESLADAFMMERICTSTKIVPDFKLSAGAMNCSVMFLPKWTQPKSHNHWPATRYYVSVLLFTGEAKGLLCRLYIKPRRWYPSPLWNAFMVNT
jgi:hypothetical protein